MSSCWGRQSTRTRSHGCTEHLKANGYALDLLLGRHMIVGHAEGWVPAGVGMRRQAEEGRVGIKPCRYTNVETVSEAV